MAQALLPPGRNQGRVADAGWGDCAHEAASRELVVLREAEVAIEHFPVTRDLAEQRGTTRIRP
eukprot:1055375-Lingulodinium_polyedra.AAC.1